MEITYIIGLVTVLVTWVLGILSKKSKFIDNNLIPIQNLIVGAVSFGIDYLITGDFNTALLFSGLTAGGAYDILNNLKKFRAVTPIESEDTVKVIEELDENETNESEEYNESEE